MQCRFLFRDFLLYSIVFTCIWAGTTERMHQAGRWEGAMQCVRIDVVSVDEQYRHDVSTVATNEVMADDNDE